MKKQYFINRITACGLAALMLFDASFTTVMAQEAEPVTEALSTVDPDDRTGDTETGKTDTVTVVEKKVSLFQQGEIPDEEKQTEESGENGSEAAEAIQEDLVQMAAQTDLQAYDLTADETADIYQSVVNESSGLFYAGDSLQVSCDEEGMAVSVAYTYTEDESEIAEQKAAYDQALNQIVAQVDPEWTDVQKALFVNDYLVTTSIYDHTLTHHDAYSLLVNKTGVCQAYALAYQAVMEALGIPAFVVSSSAMNHAWNEIYVNDHWYHVDTTWNDPTSDSYGRAGHYFFLLSDAAIEKGGRLGLTDKHYGFNSGVACTDTTFDNYAWEDMDNPIVACNGDWYTIDNNRILRMNWEDGTFTEAASYADTGRSLKTGLFSYDGSLYMTDADNILTFDVNTGTFSTFLPVQNLYGIAIDAGMITGSNVTGTDYTDSNLMKFLPLYSLSPVTDGSGCSYIPGIWNQAVLVSYSGDQTTLSVPQTVSLTPEDGKASMYTVTQIGAGAFKNQQNLSSVTLPQSVVGIGEEAFDGAENLTAVNGAASHLAIGARAFYGCKNLNTLGNGAVLVDGMGESAFYNCKNLSGLNTSALTYVPDRGFYGCSSMTGLQFSNVDAFGSYAVYGCSSLEHVTLKEELTFLPRGCFTGCTSMTDINIPDSITQIDNDAFRDCTSLTSARIPEALIWYGSRVWQGCTSLQSVYIPEGITGIPTFLFAGCSALKTIELPSTLTEIETGAFYQSGLTGIDIPKGVTVLENSVFSGCDSLTDVTLPETLTKMKNAFSYCTSLEEITIPDGVTNIEAQAFYSCTSLKRITLPEELTEIGDHVFYGCSALTELELPDKLTKIGKSVFAGCSALTRLRIPASVTEIGKDIVKGTDSLTEIQLADGNTSYTTYKGVLFNADQTEMIACPAGIRHLYLPESIASIGENFASDYSFLQSLTVLNPDCEIADSSVTLMNLCLFGENSSTLAVYAAKYGNLFNPQVITGTGTYQQTLSADGSISWQFEPQEAGTYFIEFYCDTDHAITISHRRGGNGGSGVIYIEDPLDERETDTFTVNPQYQWSDGSEQTVTMRVYREVHDTVKYQIPGNYQVTIEPYTMHLLDIQANGDAACNFKVTDAKNLYYQTYPNGDLSWDYVIDRDKELTNGASNRLSLQDTVDGCVTIRLNPYLGKKWNANQQEERQNITLCLEKYTDSSTDKEDPKNPEDQECVHREVIDEDEIAPTCTEPGWTKKSHCESCGRELSVRQEIPAAGHSWDLGKVTKNATVSAAGIKTYTCKKCGATKTEQIARLQVSYTISYQGNGSTGGSMKKQQVSYGKGIKLSANAYSRKGYTFLNWNTKKDGSGKTYANKADGSKLTTTNGKTVTLYAQWKKNTYKITYRLNGGTNAKGAVTRYNITTTAITLKKPARKGYTFKGWYTDAKYKKPVSRIKKGSTGNKILYAKWTANKYTVTFAANGAKVTGKTKALSCTYGRSYKLRSNGFKRKGYTFLGWNTKKNGKGKTYKNKAAIKNLTAKANGKITLYAQWKKKK